MTRCLEWIATLLACLGLAVVAGGCAHRQLRPPCVSKCGMLLEYKGNGSMSCDDLQTAEDSLIENADAKFCSVDKRMCRENACKACFGWQIEADELVITYNEYTIPDGDGGSVDIKIPAVGTSNCAMKTMWLGANQDWRHGSYPHEFFHVIQDCETKWDGGIDPEAGPGHQGWKDMGVYDFIQDYRDGRR